MNTRLPVLAVFAVVTACASAYSRKETPRSLDDAMAWSASAGHTGTKHAAAIDATENKGPARIEASGGTDASAGTGSSADDGGALSAGPDVEVWSGQLRLFSAVLCDSWVPLPKGYPQSQEPYLERVVLALDKRGGTGAPAGRIVFGDGTPPPVRRDDVPLAVAARQDFWNCTVESPTKGFEYSVLDARASSARLTFAIAPAEVWSAECQMNRPYYFKCGLDSAPPTAMESRAFPCDPQQIDDTCTCEPDSCPDGQFHMSLVRRVFVDLAVTADGMEGLLTEYPNRDTVELRLRRAH